MGGHDRLRRVALVAATVPILLYLLLPSLVIVPMALTKGQLIQFPPDGISLHAFHDYFADQDWVRSTLLSFQVSIVAALFGCVAGGGAALALHGRRFPGRNLVTAIVLAPIVIPLIVLALGEYLLAARLHLLGGWFVIALVHAVLVTPYVFIAAQTSLTAELNPALIRSARSLGAKRLSVFRHVYWPAIRPGIVSGAVLGFAVSFDEVVVALFLQAPDAVTLPVRMFTAIQFELTPKIAASASLFILLSVAILMTQSIAAVRRQPRHER